MQQYTLQYNNINTKQQYNRLKNTMLQRYCTIFVDNYAIGKRCHFYGPRAPF